jgi:transcriptional regulator with XRE-family HTH domain
VSVTTAAASAPPVQGHAPVSAQSNGTTPGQHRPLTQRQGNGPARGRLLPVDETDPRRPHDPAWRSRTAHRTSDPAAMEALRQGREQLGWSITQAAAETGVSRPHISLLERGLRRPSASVAEVLIDCYRMSAADAEAVRGIARELAGRDSPYRTGVIPAPDTFRDTPGNATHRAAPAPPERPAPAATAEDWISWARRKAGQASRAAPRSA